MGSGKTLTATHLAFKNWYFKRHKIFSNYHLYKIPYYYLESVRQLDFPRDGVVLLDEIWRVIDCVTPDTMIVTHNNIVKASNIEGNNPLQSIDFKDNSIQNSEILNIFKRLPHINEKLIKIQTKTKSITASKSHRFFVFDKDKIIEKRLEDIKKGDFVITIDKIKEANKQYIEPKLAQFIGYVYGDGTIYYTPKEVYWKQRKALIKIDDSDKHLLKKYGEMMKKEYGLKYHIHKHKNINCYRLTIINRKFVEKLVNLLKNDKNILISKWGIRFNDIPEIIIKSNNKVLGSFMKGLYDAEGYVRYATEKSKISKDGKVIQTRIEMSIKKIDMERLKYLLLRFGINASVKKKRNGKSYIYNITIRDRESIIRFYENIGFESPKKLENLEKCIYYIKNRKNKNNFTRVYPFQDLLNNLLKEIQLKNSITLSKIEHTLYDKYGIGFLRKQFKFNTGTELLKKIIISLEKEYGKHPKIEIMKNILNSNLRIEKVINVTEVKPKNYYLYDIEVPAYENYIANGFVVHNSRFSRKTSNKFVGDILAKSRKRHLIYIFTAQVIDTIDKRIRKVMDFTNLPFSNRTETTVKVIVFRSGYPKGGNYLKTFYYNTEIPKMLYCTEEEIDMIDDSNEPSVNPPKLLWQTSRYICNDCNYEEVRDIGKCTNCESQNLKPTKPIYFKTWEEADNYGSEYWQKWFTENRIVSK
ncbi:MAG: LAGLIDADG family homing endonuclease [Candidatus Altiarchaeota archaeon]